MALREVNIPENDVGFVSCSLMMPISGPVKAPAAFSEATKKLNNLRGNISAYKTEIQSDKVVFPSSIPLPLFTP